MHSASSGLAKLLYLLEQGPRRAEPPLALHQADWILGRLSGRFGISDENNCLKLGYDAAARRWPDWLAGLGAARDCLPQVLPPGTPVGRVHERVAATCGLPGGLWVVTGTTDSTAAVLATGACRPGDAVTSLGSTLVLKVLSLRALSSPEHGVYSHRLGDLWLVGGASCSGGAVLARYFSPARLRALSPQLSPQRPTGLDYYPLPRPGERFPVNDPGLAPRLSPRPADEVVFLQALLEGIGAIERQGYALLESLGSPRPRRVLSIGGGARNLPWQHIRQRLLGVPVLRAAHQEAAYGSALLACRSPIPTLGEAGNGS